MSFVLGWILVGVIAGVLGKAIMPGKDPGGFIVTILLGIAGALLVGKLGVAMGFYREGGPTGFLAAVVAGTIGAVLLLLLYRLLIRIRMR